MGRPGAQVAAGHGAAAQQHSGPNDAAWGSASWSGESPPSWGETPASWGQAPAWGHADQWGTGAPKGGESWPADSWGKGADVSGYGYGSPAAGGYGRFSPAAKGYSQPYPYGGKGM